MQFIYERKKILRERILPRPDAFLKLGEVERNKFGAQRPAFFPLLLRNIKNDKTHYSVRRRNENHRPKALHGLFPFRSYTPARIAFPRRPRHKPLSLQPPQYGRKIVAGYPRRGVKTKKDPCGSRTSVFSRKKRIKRSKSNGAQRFQNKTNF